MRSSARLFAQLDAAATRFLCNTHVPGCAPSTSCGDWVTGWPVRASSTHAATAVPQQPSMVDLDYARRLQEMLTPQTVRQTSPPRRRFDLDSIPKFQLPAKQPASNPHRPAVDWQRVVEQVKHSGQTVTGQQMLTDKFRWVELLLIIRL